MKFNFHIQSGYIKVVKSDQLIYYEGWKQRRNIIKSLTGKYYIDYYRGLSFSDVLYYLLFLFFSIAAFCEIGY